jgi:hypothetical protein
MGRWQEALPVIRHGLGLRQETGTYASFVALAALEQALAGDLAGAKNLVADVDTEQAGGWERVMLAYADAICLASSEDPMKVRERMRMVKHQIHSGTGQFAPVHLHTAGRMIYKRMMRHLCAKPGLAGLNWWGWWNYRRGNWGWVAITVLLTPFLAITIPIGPVVLFVLWRRVLK